MWQNSIYPQNSYSKICGQFIAHCFIYCMLKLCVCARARTRMHTHKDEYTCAMVLVWGSEDNIRSQISHHCRFQGLNADLQTGATSCWAITVVVKILLLGYFIYNVLWIWTWKDIFLAWNEGIKVWKLQYVLPVICSPASCCFGKIGLSKSLSWTIWHWKKSFLK